MMSLMLVMTSAPLTALPAHAAAKQQYEIEDGVISIENIYEYDKEKINYGFIYYRVSKM